MEPVVKHNNLLLQRIVIVAGASDGVLRIFDAAGALHAVHLVWVPFDWDNSFPGISTTREVTEHFLDSAKKKHMASTRKLLPSE